MASGDDGGDFADSFGESMASPDGRDAGSRTAGRVANQRFDEAHELSGDLDESVDTNAQSMSMASPAARSKAGTAAPGRSRGEQGDSPPQDDGSGVDRAGYPPDDVEIPKRGGGARMKGGMYASADDEEDEEDEEETEDEASGAGAPVASMAASGAGGGLRHGSVGTPAGGGEASGSKAPRGYDPAEYSHLKVSKEIRELFEHIGRYKPHAHDLPTRLRPFVPDFVPSVGEIDPFLKPSRPDGERDTLGMERLDEPAATQSDSTVLELQLRALSKKSHIQPNAVRSIPEADKNPREIQKWIDNIAELHRTKPPTQVRYSKPMPDVEELMQEWPAEVEAVLQTVDAPSADVDLSLEEYARVACALTGVPVHSSDSIVQSLHVLFTLFAEFRANQHFQVGAGDGAAAPGAPGFS